MKMARPSASPFFIAIPPVNGSIARTPRAGSLRGRNLFRINKLISLFHLRKTDQKRTLHVELMIVTAKVLSLCSGKAYEGK